MARPKENVILSEAFEQKCQREKEKLKVELKRNLKEDIIRLLTEEIHPDVNITDGVDVVPSHLLILKARAKRLFEIVKIDSDKYDSINKVNIPWSNCRRLEDFVKQLYYTENVNSLIDEIEDSLNHKTTKKIDDLNHNSCYSNHKNNTLNPTPESNSQNTGEIHLSDVHLTENVNTVENFNCNPVSICISVNEESRNGENVCEGKENISITDNNGSTSITKDNVSTSIAKDNVSTSIAKDNVSTSIAKDNVSTSVAADNVSTSIAADNVSTSVTDDNVSTSVTDDNVSTSVTDDNVSTLVTDNTNLPDLIKLSYSLSLPHQCCSILGEDLLRAFLQEMCCDCSLVVAGQQFKAHKFVFYFIFQKKCILAARSEYFEAMLGGQWRESDSQTIELEGINPGAVEQALLYLYGGVIDVIETCNVPDLLVVGDMYGMKGLKHISSFLIIKDYCHFFHKPCSSCLSLAGDALTLAVTYNLQDLQEKCIKWINRYFTKFWSSRSFASQHEDILTLCCDQLISQISEQNVVDMIMDSHKLQGNVPHVKWAEPILHLTSQLMTATIQFISNNFISIMGSKQFLGWEKGAAWNLSVLEDIFGQVIESVSPSNGCKIYQALLRLDEYNASLEDSSGREDLHEFIKYLLKKSETFLRVNIHQVTLTEDWAVLPETIRNKILSCASYVCFDSGNNMTRKRPPKLPSSRKTNISGAVIQSLRDDHEFKKKATSLNKNSTNSKKLISNSGSHTKSKQISNKTPVTSSASAANPSLPSTSRQNGHPKSGKSSKVIKKVGSIPKEEIGDSSKEVTHSYLRLKAAPSYHRQISWSPESDRIPSPSNTSPRITTKIPIFRSSSLSPFQERSRPRSPDTVSVTRYADTNQSLLATQSSQVKEADGLAEPVVLRKHKTLTDDMKERRWSSPAYTIISSDDSQLLKRSTSTMSSCLESRSIGRDSRTRLLPLFEVVFHQPSQ
ncbi:hypothetical protein LOTGIDRAFT_162329 [Lottia gigantea]|uniref:BTB domain-containing protein n=1 Tax=Lottia gigantea TaxID=225164 RepID=V4A822_LOTGI|nr:hypothetical protein LOTGIDRAFT_162329 [Lottia gigantea]ESO92852.1 hypothetical protein LOTGIDRAFT_162329 [Lottia gigantea]